MLNVFTKFYYTLLSHKENPRHRESAINLIAYMKSVYANPHEFYRADISAYKNIDISFYDKITNEFLDNEFTKVIDMEDFTMTQSNPHMKTCIRYFTNETGSINASCMHLNFGKVAKFLSIFTNNPANIYSIELATELANGNFIITNNLAETSRLIDYPDTIKVHKFSRDTSVKAMLDFHTSVIASQESEIINIESIADIITSIDKVLKLKNRFMKSKGYANREMFEMIKGKKLSKDDEKFIKVLERVKEEQYL